MKFILGKKISMSQIFDKEGNVIPITWVKAGPCFITQIKTKEKDGYSAVQVGFGKKKKAKKTEKGKEFYFLKEFRVPEEEIKNFKVGQEIDVSFFKEGEKVKVSGKTIGRGFQGVVKRWGFKGAPKTHGTKHQHRKPGSIGCAWPQRVLKGKKMAGKMSPKRITQISEIVKVDKEKGMIALKGSLPGKKGNLIEIKTVS